MRARQREKAHARQMRQSEKTKRLMEARLYGFDCENCRAYHLLCEKLKDPNKSKLTKNIILPIAEVLSVVEGIPLPREAYRKRAYLILWCEENFEPLQRSLSRMILHFTGGETIVGELAAQKRESGATPTA